MTLSARMTPLALFVNIIDVTAWNPAFGWCINIIASYECI